MDVFDQMLETCKEIIHTVEKKTHDYGDIRENDPFGAFGIVVRMNDKMRRLITIAKQGACAIENENAQDTIKDLIGYALWLLIIQKKEPSNVV